MLLLPVPTNNLIRCQCSETGPRNVAISKKDKLAGRAYADILRGCAFRFFIDRPVAGQGREPRNITGQCLVAAPTSRTHSFRLIMGLEVYHVKVKEVLDGV